MNNYKDYVDELTSNICELYVLSNTDPFFFFSEDYDEVVDALCESVIENKENLEKNETIEFLRNFRKTLLKNENINYVSDFIEETDYLLDEALGVLNTVFAIMYAKDMVDRYRSIENRLAACKRLRGAALFRCQVSGYNNAISALRSAEGRCVDEKNPDACRDRIEKAVERLEKEKAEAEKRLAQMQRARMQSENTLEEQDEEEQQEQQPRDDNDRKRRREEQIRAAQAKLRVAKQKMRVGARFAAQQARTGAEAAGRGAKEVTRRPGYWGRTAAKVGAASAASYAGFDVAQSIARKGAESVIRRPGRIADLGRGAAGLAAASLLGSLIATQAIRIISRNRIDACDQTLKGTERRDCRIKVLQGILNELRSMRNDCGRDQRCLKRINKQIETTQDRINRERERM